MVEDKKVTQKTKEWDLQDSKDLFGAINNSKSLEDDFSPLIIKSVKKLIDQAGLAVPPKIVFLYEPDRSIRDFTANQIYKSISSEDGKKDILLFLVSMGGSVEPAYLISKICKEFSGKFIVAVPRKAKSAATLLSLGADEVHMGIMSELGPIDPQIGSLPALGLSDAVQYLAELCKKYPESSDMFAKYLSNKLDLRILGYFRRVSESAEYYAEKLLESKTLPQGQDASLVAKRLVNFYKDHSFVIDKDEAKTLLGNTIKTNTAEYKLCDSIYKLIDSIHLYVKVFKKKDLAIIGDLSEGIFYFETEESD